MHYNRGTVFSTPSVLRCYKQEKSVELLRFSRCEAMLWQAGNWGRDSSTEQGERPPLEAATKQRLSKTVTDWQNLVCRIAICEVRRTVSPQSLLVVMRFKSSINPITNSSPVHSHQNRENILICDILHTVLDLITCCKPQWYKFSYKKLNTCSNFYRHFFTTVISCFLLSTSLIT
jgi:hypothetical protein